jgi:hypothetical protein
MSITDHYSTRLRQTQGAVMGATEAWIEGVKAQFSLIQTAATGQVGPKGTLEQAARLTKRLVETNVRYMQDLAGASLGIVGAVRDDAGKATKAVKDEAASAGKVVGDQVDKLGDSAVEQAEELQRVQRQQAGQAKRAARQAAAERYENMTKPELAEELASRNLAKSGNVPELRARLIDDDRRSA